MKTRDEIITDMCYTWRHDYGLVKDGDDVLSSGMTQEEQNLLRAKMTQLFDNCIQPKLKKEKSVNSAVGTVGHLISSFDGSYFIRVYDKTRPFEFEDYDIKMGDFELVIIDKDAYFYSDGKNKFIDYSPSTLGIRREDCASQK